MPSEIEKQIEYVEASIHFFNNTIDRLAMSSEGSWEYDQLKETLEFNTGVVIGNFQHLIDIS